MDLFIFGFACSNKFIQFFDGIYVVFNKVVIGSSQLLGIHNKRFITVIIAVNGIKNIFCISDKPQSLVIVKYTYFYRFKNNDIFGRIMGIFDSLLDCLTGIFFTESFGTGEAFLRIQSERIIFPGLYFIAKFLHFYEQFAI